MLDMNRVYESRIAALEAERDGQADQAATYRKRCRQYADQLAALEAEVAELRDGLHNARYQLRWIESKANRMLNKETGK